MMGRPGWVLREESHPREQCIRDEYQILCRLFDCDQNKANKGTVVGSVTSGGICYRITGNSLLRAVNLYTLSKNSRSIQGDRYDPVHGLQQ